MNMKLSSNCLTDNGPIPAECAFCIPDPKNHATISQNLNPDLAWTDLPAGTRSLALICVDTDAPRRADDVNKEDRVVPANLPRANFHHWVIVDLPPDASPIGKGEFSSRVTPKGKGGPLSPRGVR